MVQTTVNLWNKTVWHFPEFCSNLLIFTDITSFFTDWRQIIVFFIYHHCGSMEAKRRNTGRRNSGSRWLSRFKSMAFFVFNNCGNESPRQLTSDSKLIKSAGYILSDEDLQFPHCQLCRNKMFLIAKDMHYLHFFLFLEINFPSEYSLGISSW